MIEQLYKVGQKMGGLCWEFKEPKGPKGRIPSTEGKGEVFAYDICWAKSKPKGPKGSKSPRWILEIGDPLLRSERTQGFSAGPA